MIESGSPPSPPSRVASGSRVAFGAAVDVGERVHDAEARFAPTSCSDSASTAPRSSTSRTP